MVQGVQGYFTNKKQPHRAKGIVLPQGPRGALFLMGEVACGVSQAGLARLVDQSLEAMKPFSSTRCRVWMKDSRLVGCNEFRYSHTTKKSKKKAGTQDKKKTNIHLPRVEYHQAYNLY
jgi:hypothetical protein